METKEKATCPQTLKTIEQDLRILALMRAELAKWGDKNSNVLRTEDVCEPCEGRTSSAQLLENLW